MNKKYMHRTMIFYVVTLIKTHSTTKRAKRLFIYFFLVKK